MKKERKNSFGFLFKTGVFSFHAPANYPKYAALVRRVLDAIRRPLDAFRSSFDGITFSSNILFYWAEDKNSQNKQKLSFVSLLPLFPIFEFRKR